MRRPGRGLEGMLSRLAAAYPWFDFGTQRTRDGTALAAVRRKRGEPGLYAVITPDPEELRDALREDAKEFPPGSKARPGGDQHGPGG